MYRKNYLTGFLTIALLLFGGMAAFAQTTAPITGRIVKNGADGKPVPVEGALVELYRTDINNKPLTDTTDKKGSFQFAGVQVGYVYALSVSGPGLDAVIVPNFKAGMENQTVTVLAGSGNKFTDQEVREGIANIGKTQQAPQSSAEQKKQQEEYEKKLAAATAENEKIQNKNAAIQKALEEGNAAFSSKNYDVAIVKFEEGYQVSPEFLGSAPVFLNNKGQSLKLRAVALFNENAKKDKASQEAAKPKVQQDLVEAAEAYNKSWTLLKSASATGTADLKINENKVNTLNGAKEIFRIMAFTRTVDTTKTEIAKTLLTEYVAIESDQAKKAEAQRIMGDIYMVSFDYANAIAEYKKVLEMNPNDVDAIANTGLSMVTLGYMTMQGDSSKNIPADEEKGKVQLQEAANMLQKFIDIAPADHKLLASVKESMNELKALNVAPAKGKTTTNTKKKN